MKMLERSKNLATSLTSPIKTLIKSLQLILSHKRRYFLIYFLASLPLSLTQTSLSITLYPLRHHRSTAISLLISRSLISLPLLLPLSLLSSSASISSTLSFLSSPSSPPPSLLSSVRLFPRVLATCICAHALMWAYLCIPSLLLLALSATATSAPASFLIRVIGWVGEVYLMGVLGIGIVATVASTEEEVGWGAVREGWRVVGRRKWSSWVITIGFGLGTWGIWGGVLEGKMDGQDWSGVVGLVRWMRGIGPRAWLVALYGGLILWSSVVYTVIYWESSKRIHHSNSNVGEESELQLQINVR